MAENQEQSKPKEKEIPVFTVLKSNCILKNIFLLDKPHSISSTWSLPVSENADQESEIEEILVVGRHPDCNIKLEHPSISRFHLRIHSKPSSRSLFVTDLSSVHGTWVSGRRIEPGVTIKVKEGDTLQLGASSRLYRLNWVPLSSAYDIDDPFVPPLDSPDTVDEETEVAIDQDGDSVSYRDNELKGVSHEDIGLSTQKISPSAPPILKDLSDPFSHKDEVENNVSLEKYNEENELSISQLCQLDDSVTIEEETEGVTDQDEGPGLTNDIEGLEWLFSDKKIAPLLPEDLYRSFPEKNEANRNCSSPEICVEDIEQENSIPQAHMPLAFSQAETKDSSGLQSEKRSGLSIRSRRGNPKNVKIETSQSNGKYASANISSQVKSVIDKTFSSNYMLKDNQYASPDNNDEIFTPDKENTSPNSSLVRSLKCKFEESLKGESISNSPVPSVDEVGEIFTPAKENVTPDRSMKKRLNSYRPSPLKIVINENMHHEEFLVPKANRHQKVLQESKSIFSVSKSHATMKKQQPVSKARTDREPFHSLPLNSSTVCKADSINSVQESTLRSCRSIKNLESEDVVNQSHKNTTNVSKKRWTIIADTTCLLNRKSRNELQLLRGLRGTTLVIPRIVVRELDCMLRRASFFSRMTEASAALNWIKECMAESKQWIHVQTSAEEGSLVPPTPPAAASHWFGEERSPFSVGSIPFSPYMLQEIVTPTPADHILECALLFWRATNGQLVLLSDDVTLKIKAMAEGVICETVEEFRGSLVNPFSTRFLYFDSSPIGPTWSCFGDTVLKEKYYPSPSKTNSRSGEGAKGLQLILLHNFDFMQVRN